MGKLSATRKNRGSPMLEIGMLLTALLFLYPIFISFLPASNLRINCINP